MDTAPLGNDPDRREINELLGLFDAPAYVRRARGVEEALARLVARGNAQRDEWLEIPRLRLGELRALAGDWGHLADLLADDGEIRVLEALWAALTPQLVAPPAATTSRRRWRNALANLVTSLEFFNARWREYLAAIDVGPVNGLRDGYNRYYVLEKSCALRSDLLARMHFAPLPPLDVAELERLLPPLPVPRPRA